MKICTDISQSKVLLEILPLNTADMWWTFYTVTDAIGHLVEMKLEEPVLCNFNWFNRKDNIPAWSLAALLDAMPKIINNETLFIETSAALWHIGYRNIYTARADNPIDACVELIIKLHEKGLL